MLCPHDVRPTLKLPCRQAPHHTPSLYAKTKAQRLNTIATAATLLGPWTQRTHEPSSAILSFCDGTTPRQHANLRDDGGSNKPHRETGASIPTFLTHPSTTPHSYSMDASAILTCTCVGGPSPSIRFCCAWIIAEQGEEGWKPFRIHSDLRKELPTGEAEQRVLLRLEEKRMLCAAG